MSVRTKKLESTYYQDKIHTDTRYFAGTGFSTSKYEKDHAIKGGQGNQETPFFQFSLLTQKKDPVEISTHSKYFACPGYLQA